MGRSKRKFETMSFVSESLSTNESHVDSSPNSHNAWDAGETSGAKEGANEASTRLETNVAEGLENNVVERLENNVAEGLENNVAEGVENNVAEGLENEVTRKKRGKTVMESVWRLPANKRIVVKCSPDWLPVGKGGKCLANYLGVVVRMHCPLNYKDWNEVPIGTKRHLLRFIEKKIVFPSEMNKWLKKTMPARWRYYKADLKARHFISYESLEDNLKRCPADVLVDQWEYLVSYWMSDAGKKRSTKNKNNRKEQTITHTTGSLSYAHKIDEHDAENGTNVGRIDGFQVTHVRKDGSYLDDEVPKILEKAKAKKAKRLKKRLVDPYKDEVQILTKVIGSKCKRRVQSVGGGLSATDVFGRKSSNALVNHTNEEFDNLKKELAKQKEITAKEQQLRIAQGEMIHNLQEGMAEMQRLMQIQSSSRTHLPRGKRPMNPSNSSYNIGPGTNCG